MTREQAKDEILVVGLNLEQWALVIEALDFTTEDGLNPAYDEDRMALSRTLKQNMMRDYNITLRIDEHYPGFRMRDFIL